ITSLICYPMGCLFSRSDIQTATRRFKVKKLIATGGFSEVHLAEDMNSGEKYAMKKIKLVEEREMEKVKWEIDMHLKFGSHVNIVPLVCDARPDELEFCLFFPYFANGSVAALQEKNRSTNTFVVQSEVLCWMEGVSSALSLLHSHSYAHRDIKPHNILLTPNRKPMLTDFGSSVLMPIHIGDGRESQLRRDEAAEMSSMPYRAPELFTCDIDSDLTVAVDIWSLACLFYSFCYFISPFESVYEKGNSIALAVQSPNMIQYSGEAPYDDAVVDMIKGMFSVEANTRPSIDDVIQNINTIINRN
ncbi:hypothetical protein PENTCL1PPCAC_11697, partial [Pristionchus entomophagus]